MMESSRTDPSQLTGEESREEGTLKPRDFFWDSCILYLVSVILALSVVDALSEYIKGSSVVCDVKENDPTSSDYVNSYCTNSLPITELLPAFIFIHGLIIAIPHYLWVATFSGQFDYFFSVVSTIDRHRNEYTGRYSEKNYNIVRQLEQSFTTFGRNTIYYLYICKLSLQLLLVIGSVILLSFYFTDYNVVFQCPPSLENNDSFWPLDRQVMCIFTSLKLLYWIRIADIVLVCLLLLSILWGLGWSFAGHPLELGADSVAKFSFHSGINTRFFVAPFSRYGKCNKCLATVFSWFPWRFRSPGVTTDLDFMLLKLYRTNGGLGSAFKEMLIDLKLRKLKENEQETLTLHRNRMNATKDENEIFWLFSMKEDKTPYQSFKTINSSTSIEVPGSVRGAILGLSTYSPNNKGALYINTGSESGIGEALSRVFDRVGSVRFTHKVVDIQDEGGEGGGGGSIAQKIIDLQVYVSSYVSVMLPTNILSLSINYKIELLSSIDKIWKVVMKSGKRELVITKKTSFIVIGPMESEEEGVTMTHFMKRIQHNFETGCVLCIMRPVKISGRKVKFIEWTPPENFTEQKLSIVTTPNSLQWPPKPIIKPDSGTTLQEDIDLESLVGDKPEKKKKEKTQFECRNVQQQRLTCGGSSQLVQYEISTYVYDPPDEGEPAKQTDSEQKLSKTTNKEEKEVTAEIH